MYLLHVEYLPHPLWSIHAYCSLPLTSLPACRFSIFWNLTSFEPGAVCLLGVDHTTAPLCLLANLILELIFIVKILNYRAALASRNKSQLQSLETVDCYPISLNTL